MTPGQYRLHRCATMRAAMRASAIFEPLASKTRAGVRSGAYPLTTGVSDPSPGREPHNRAPMMLHDGLALRGNA